MKKLFVAVALVMGLGTSVAFAENFHASVDSVNIVNEFKPIEVKDLPQAVLDAVTKDYAEFTIKEAYVEEVEGTKTYKVVLTDAEDNTTAVLYTEKGEVIGISIHTIDGGMCQVRHVPVFYFHLI